ncbi:hypothetical protein [Mucilaginibacter lacusdianchii]|uniref:hypothetical protein n=1 Tax=Mucilaginibacter lacusdianchii TaxID=2684211 RepID=UPI00131DF6C0|nr:hypothetical protein [Mucilaginibacter sp. JXJ CY 39]
MNKRKDPFTISPRTRAQWKLHRQIAANLNDLDRLPDAQAVRENRPRAAPRHLLPMVF